MNTKELIRTAVIKSIKNFAKKKINKKAKFQILDLLIPKERKIRSIVGGLETSLGTTLWEPLAKTLAQHNGFEVIENKLEAPTNMPASLQNILSNILEDRKSDTPSIDGNESHSQIKKACQKFIKSPIDNYTKAPRGFGVDIWLKKNDTNYFFDTKTVQPNVGTYTKCMEQVLTWYTYFYARFPTQQSEAKIVFPYNPDPGSDFWLKTMNKGRPLDSKHEALVGNQFWDFCSGEKNTYEAIAKTFEEIAASGELTETIYDLLS